MNNIKIGHRPSEKNRKLIWRLCNAAFVALFAGLTWRFYANRVLLIIFGMCAVFALVNVFVVPKRNQPRGLK